MHLMHAPKVAWTRHVTSADDLSRTASAVWSMEVHPLLCVSFELCSCPCPCVPVHPCVAQIRQHNAALVEQAQLVSHELIRMAILWHEMWHEVGEGMQGSGRQSLGHGLSVGGKDSFCCVVSASA